MKYMLLLVLVFLCYGCAVGAATAGYALKATTADQLSPDARKSIVDEVKEWANNTFQKR